MKKFVAFWLSLALTLSLTACSGGGDSSPRSSEGGFSSSASVSLPQEEAPAITSLTLDCDQTMELDVKDTLSIPVEVLEEGAELNQVEFTSSDPAVLTFTAQEENGALVGVAAPQAEGTAEIYASAGEVKSQIITVTVIDSERIAAEEAAKKAAEEEAARKAAEEAAAQQPERLLRKLPRSRLPRRLPPSSRRRRLWFGSQRVVPNIIAIPIAAI